MASGRNRKENKVYNKYRRTDDFRNNCVFCEFTDKHEQVIKEYGLFFVSKNIFPYSYHDDQDVQEHLLIVPKRHIDAVGKFNNEEKLGLVEIIGEYEKAGYNFLGRAPQSPIKSIPHQHTHLIKPGKKVVNYIFYSSKPDFRWIKWKR